MRLFPKDKGVIHHTAKDSGADFFASDISPTQTPCTFRSMVVVSVTTRLSATINHDGSDEMTVHFNAGSDLTADCVYIFDLLVHQGDTVNYEVNDAIDVEIFRVQEIPFGDVT